MLEYLVLNIKFDQRYLKFKKKKPEFHFICQACLTPIGLTILVFLKENFDTY